MPSKMKGQRTYDREWLDQTGGKKKSERARQGAPGMQGLLTRF